MAIASEEDGEKYKKPKQEEAEVNLELTREQRLRRNGVHTNGFGTKRPNYVLHPIAPESYRDELYAKTAHGIESVPLRLFVDRLLVQTYSQLTELAEVLPGVAASQGELARKRRLMDWVLSRRRQFIKALVVVRWAKEIGEVELSSKYDHEQHAQSSKQGASASSSSGASLAACRSIVQFLHRSNDSLMHVVSRFQEIRSELQAARVRAAEVEGAINLLCQDEGTTLFRASRPLRSRLPAVLFEEYSPKKYEKQRSKDVLDELDRRLQRRLALDFRDRLPEQWRRYTIHEGKILFRVANRYSISFRAVERQGDIIWHLMDAEMLLGSKASTQPDLQAQFRSQVLVEGSQYLEPNTDDKHLHPMRALYFFVDNLWASYMMDALAMQFQALVNFKGLKIKASTENQNPHLTVEYWPDLPASGALYPGETEVMMKKWTEADRAIGQWRSRGLIEITAKFGSPNLHEKSRIDVTWGAAGQHSVVIGPDLLELVESQLKASTIMTIVLRRHADKILENISTSLSTKRSIGHILPEKIVHREGQLVVQLQSQSDLKISIVPSNGMFAMDLEISQCARLYDMNRASQKVLDAAKERLNSNPRLALDIVLTLRWQGIVSDVQRQIATAVPFLQRNVHQPLRTEEQKKFGEEARFVLLYRLSENFPNENMGIILTDTGIRYVLVELYRRDQGATIRFAVQTMDEIKSEMLDHVINGTWLEQVCHESIERIRFKQLQRHLQLLLGKIQTAAVCKQDMFARMAKETTRPMLQLAIGDLISWQNSISDPEIIFETDLSTIRLRLRPHSCHWCGATSRGHCTWNPITRELLCKNATLFTLGQCLTDLFDCLWMKSIEHQAMQATEQRNFAPLKIKDFSLFDCHLSFTKDHFLAIKRASSICAVRLYSCREDGTIKESCMDIFADLIQSTLERDPSNLRLVLATLQHWALTMESLDSKRDNVELVLAPVDLFNVRILFPGLRKILACSLTSDWKISIRSGVRATKTLEKSPLIERAGQDEHESQRCLGLIAMLESEREEARHPVAWRPVSVEELRSSVETKMNKFSEPLEVICDKAETSNILEGIISRLFQQ